MPAEEVEAVLIARRAEAAEFALMIVEAVTLATPGIKPADRKKGIERLQKQADMAAWLVETRESRDRREAPESAAARAKIKELSDAMKKGKAKAKG